MNLDSIGLVCCSCGLCCSKDYLCEDSATSTLEANGLPLTYLPEITGLKYKSPNHGNSFDFSEVYYKLQSLQIKYMNEQIDLANNEAIEFVKNNIDYPFDLIDFSHLSSWEHVGYVEVEESNYTNGFYPSYKFYQEIGKPEIQYMRQSDEGAFHELVYQKTGACEDDFYGYMLYSLKDGRYWKISFN